MTPLARLAGDVTRIDHGHAIGAYGHREDAAGLDDRPNRDIVLHGVCRTLDRRLQSQLFDHALHGVLAREVGNFGKLVGMGVSCAGEIERGLLGGLPPATPIVVVQNASLPRQRHACGTLATLQRTIDDNDLASPSIIVVGDALHGLSAASSSSVEWHQAMLCAA